jgi:predicted dipeptidase
MIGSLVFGLLLAPDLAGLYQQRYAAKLQPLLCEAVRFETYDGNTDAHAKARNWLRRVAGELGLSFRDTGAVIEVDLPGPPGAPVLGLVVHGDVVPAGNAADWSVPPFTCTERGGLLYGRGVVDDKGPLVQALLAMATLRDSRRARTHTVRLLVGWTEESAGTDMTEYRKVSRAPDLSLVLDSDFPVVVGEKAWDALEVTAAEPWTVRGDTAGWRIVALEAGTGTSIVPNRATAVIAGAVERDFAGAKLPDAYRVETAAAAEGLRVTVFGRAAHAGMNIAGGRNALVMLARMLEGKLAPSGAADLLAFARLAGQDLHGTGLGIDQNDPLWGRFAVNPATVKGAPAGGLMLTVNFRRIPPTTATGMKARLTERLAEFNAQHGSRLTAGGYFEDEPFSVDPEARLVKRLLATYQRATGRRDRPTIIGGGTYARRLPNAVAFGMWFPGAPYPGHDTDERIPVRDLQLGVKVLLETLVDLACGPPLRDPLAR